MTNPALQNLYNMVQLDKYENKETVCRKNKTAERMGEEVKAMDEKKQGLQENGTRQDEEQMPTRWYCDTDCRASNRACRGESGKDPTAKNLCPYFEDMLF